MILLYPLLLAAAIVLVRRAEGEPRVAGSAGFLLWTAAGALFTFSLLTGFSIGLFVLPGAAVVLLVAARWAPRAHEAIGFVEGVGAILLLVAGIQGGAAGWLIPGLVCTAAATAGFAVAQTLRVRDRL